MECYPIYMEIIRSYGGCGHEPIRSSWNIIWISFTAQVVVSNSMFFHVLPYREIWVMICYLPRVTRTRIIQLVCKCFCHGYQPTPPLTNPRFNKSLRETTNMVNRPLTRPYFPGRYVKRGGWLIRHKTSLPD